MDRFNEIYHTLRKNPGRTFLTAFGVGWGIFMLIVTIGMSNGLENGIRHMFSGFTSNGVFVWGGKTSISHNGFPEGRRLHLYSSDIEKVERQVEGIDILAPRNQLGGYRGGNNVKYNNKTGAFSVNGDIPDIRKVYLWKVPKGRFINQTDMDQHRKVAVIGTRVRDVLFEGKNPIGEYIQINNVFFRVIGIFKPQTSGERTERDLQTIIIPLSTFQNVFNSRKYINWFAIVCDDDAKGSDVEAAVKNVLRISHKVHPDDDRAFGSFNVEERYGQMNMIFTAVKLVAWFVGIVTLLAGVIGVMNIMLITVKERTKEIGIRRAIGAKPIRIISQVIAEAVVLTLIAGYVGLLVGTWGLEALGWLQTDGQTLRDPSVRLNVAVASLVILVVSGALAGLLPAYRAVQIKPVDALRDE
jgi:putative ABC transport system permease protein